MSRYPGWNVPTIGKLEFLSRTLCTACEDGEENIMMAIADRKEPENSDF